MFDGRGYIATLVVLFQVIWERTWWLVLPLAFLAMELFHDRGDRDYHNLDIQVAAAVIIAIALRRGGSSRRSR